MYVYYTQAHLSLKRQSSKIYNPTSLKIKTCRSRTTLPPPLPLSIDTMITFAKNEWTEEKLLRGCLYGENLPGSNFRPWNKIFPGRKNYCVYMGTVHRLTGENWTQRFLCETSKETQWFYESCDGQKLTILIAIFTEHSLWSCIFSSSLFHNITINPHW